MRMHNCTYFDSIINRRKMDFTFSHIILYYNVMNICKDLRLKLNTYIHTIPLPF